MGKTFRDKKNHSNGYARGLYQKKERPKKTLSTCINCFKALLDYEVINGNGLQCFNCIQKLKGK